MRTINRVKSSLGAVFSCSLCFSVAWSLIAVATVALDAHAQELSRPSSPGRAKVDGVVADSIRGLPLQDAVVQLLSRDEPSNVVRSAVSDANGRFVLTDVPMGRYTLGFVHPFLDSLGIAPPVREIVVGDVSVHADLGVPSSERLRFAICGVQARETGVVIGLVIDAINGRPVTGATVEARWLELVITQGRLGRRYQHATATSGENGWFALCGVPRIGALTLVARGTGFDTDTVEEQVPANGLLRRELYVGLALSSGTDSADASRKGSQPARPRRRGTGTLRGTVLAASNGRAIEGARVSVADGAESISNVLGEWTLAAVPQGTRILEVRAVGYYPTRLSVNVFPGAPPLRLVLPTLKTVLDTIRVHASFATERQIEFNDRRRKGAGRYLTPSDIALRAPTFTSDIFRTIAGVRVENDRSGAILLRGAFDAWCRAAIYLNGHYTPDLAVEDIDDWQSNPKNIVGIEVYSEGTAPPQFQPGLSGCGSVVIWTK